MELSKKEQGSLLKSGVSTVSFYRGNAPVECLQRRVAAILSENPWLGYRLARRGEEVVLEQREALGADHFTAVRGNAGEFWTANPGDAVAKYSSFCVPSGAQCLESGDLLFRVAVLAEPDRFVLVTSVSHMIGDGYTYYELHGMLAPNGHIRALNRELVDVAEAEADALGDSARLLASSAFGAGLAKNRGRANEYPCQMYFELDPAALEAVKAESRDEGVPFLSSNDVVTATFLSASRADLGLMAVNLRSRLRGIGGDSAGSYESSVAYLAEDFSASRIRQSVADGRLRRVGAAQLPAEKLEDGRISLLSNWRSFAAKRIVAFEGCELVMHVPVTSAGVFGFLDFGILFMPRPGATAIMLRGIGACRSVEAVRASALGRILGSELRIPDE